MGELMHRVLLVDDEPSVLKMIGKRPEFEGFEVLVAVDGEQAVAMARKEHPDVIILDLMLPKLSGFVSALRPAQNSSRPINEKLT